MKLIIFVSLFIISIGAQAQTSGGKPAGKPIQNFFGDKTRIENPFRLRDPFKGPTNRVETLNKERGFYKSGKGQYSNISDPALDQLSVSQIKVVGVLIGKERRALVNVGKDEKDQKIVILKEGMKVGPEAAELKAILPGGIVLVEKIVNVYGEEEFLETVIPISR